MKLPEGIITIGDYAFQNCGHLEEINFPSTLTRVGTKAFHNCEKLKIYPNNAVLNRVGKLAFQYCLKIDSIALSDDITVIRYSTILYY